MFLLLSLRLVSKMMRTQVQVGLFIKCSLGSLQLNLKQSRACKYIHMQDEPDECGPLIDPEKKLKPVSLAHEVEIAGDFGKLSADHGKMRKNDNEVGGVSVPINCFLVLHVGLYACDGAVPGCNVYNECVHMERRRKPKHSRSCKIGRRKKD